MFILMEIKYQFLRNRNRSVLTVCIAALLVCCMALYLGNIQSGEAALENLAEAVPVSVQVVNRPGTSSVGLEIDEHHFEGIMAADIHDPVYTASAIGVMDETKRADEVTNADTTITGMNSLAAMNGLSEEAITFADGWDAGFLGGGEAACVLSDTYAEAFDLSLGDVVTLPLYVTRYNVDGYMVPYIPIGDCTVQVVGIYQTSMTASPVPVQMIVPVGWMKTAVEDGGESFMYDSFRCTLQDPTKLNEFKESMRNNSFAQINENATNQKRGDALIVEDQLFVETAEKLQQNLKVLRWFLVPFFALVIMLVTLVTFLVLRSGRRDIAIASSLGRSKQQSALSYFLGTLLADAVGCAAALPVLLAAAGLTVTQALSILGMFLICACVGIWLALVFLLRFDTLSLLTKVD